MRIVWTKEKCHEKALKYKTRTDFKKKCNSVYEIARKNKWLDNICSHISKIRYWTKEKCHKEALKYTNKSEFRKYSLKAYSAAFIYKWLDEICSHMNNKCWTKETCWKEALKYKTRKEFNEFSHKAYISVLKHKWMHEICSHMKKIGNKLNRCIYVYEFPNNYAYIGLTYNLEKRNIDRMSQNNDAVTKYIRETNLKPTLKQLTDYMQVDIAAMLEDYYIEFYRNNGWNVLNKVNGGAIGCPTKKWTKEKCQAEALNYKTRSEFYCKNNKVYAAAQRYDWLDEICQHMEFKIHHWTIDEVKIEALKYNARNEFAENSKNAYIWAIRHKVLNEICSHMNCMIGSNQYKQKV
jgi:hypothetical protein